jgi:hypothetical protein
MAVVAVEATAVAVTNGSGRTTQVRKRARFPGGLWHFPLAALAATPSSISGYTMQLHGIQSGDSPLETR